MWAYVAALLTVSPVVAKQYEDANVCFLQHRAGTAEFDLDSANDQPSENWTFPPTLTPTPAPTKEECAQFRVLDQVAAPPSYLLVHQQQLKNVCGGNSCISPSCVDVGWQRVCGLLDGQANGRRYRKNAYIRDKHSWQGFNCYVVFSCAGYKYCPSNYKWNVEALGRSTSSCCTPSCSIYDCPSGYKRRSDADEIFGNDFTTCCAGVPCNEFTCPAGSSKKEAGEDIVYDGRKYPCCKSPSIKANEALTSGQSLRVPGGELIMQDDGNVVLYKTEGGQHVAWRTDTTVSGSRFKVQDDCNIVVYKPDGSPNWARCNDPNGRQGCASNCTGASLVFQYDLNLVLYRDGEALWETRTNK